VRLQARDQHVCVVETVGLEPTAFCLQSRTRGFSDQAFCTSSQARGRFSSTLLSTVVPCRAMQCGLSVDSARIPGLMPAPGSERWAAPVTDQGAGAWADPGPGRLQSWRVGGTSPYVTAIYWVDRARFPTLSLSTTWRPTPPTSEYSHSRSSGATWGSERRRGRCAVDVYTPPFQKGAHDRLP
jgi:hypothetical protein